MKVSTILDVYQAWLTHREYSPATVQKYTHAPGPLFRRHRRGQAP